MPYLYSLGVEGVQARAGRYGDDLGQHEIDAACREVCHSVYAVAAGHRQAYGRSRGRAISLADRQTRLTGFYRFYLSNEQFLLYRVKRLKSSQNVKLLQEILAVTG